MERTLSWGDVPQARRAQERAAAQRAAERLEVEELLKNTEVAAAAKEALGTPVREAAGTFGDEDQGYRLLGVKAKRDLSPVSQVQMQKAAAYLWETNLLANRLVELPVAYLVAEGVKLSSTDPEHQEWLDAFWNDPINKMDQRLPTLVRELSLFGEQCWTVFVNEINGHVRLGYLDPSLIGDVLTDPGNPAQEIGVRTVKDDQGNQREFRVIVRGEDEELFAPEARVLRAGYGNGDAFYFAINKFAAGRRGRSDLLAGADWLDAFDEYMFDQIERAGELDAFIWDVKLTGADQAQIDERAKKIKRPGRGSVRVHNEQEEWTASAPDLNITDRSESARMFRNHAMGGATVPEHWYGGGDVNRAVGAEMGEPFFKMVTMRQTAIRHMLSELGGYVLYQRAKKAGISPDWGKPEWRVTVTFPEMVTKDVARLATALQSCVVAVSSAITGELITRETGLRIIAVAARRLDIDIDPQAELEAVEAEIAANRTRRPLDAGVGVGAAQPGVPEDLQAELDEDDGDDASGGAPKA